MRGRALTDPSVVCNWFPLRLRWCAESAFSSGRFRRRRTSMVQCERRSVPFLPIKFNRSILWLFSAPVCVIVYCQLLENPHRIPFTPNRAEQKRISNAVQSHENPKHSPKNLNGCWETLQRIESHPIVTFSPCGFNLFCETLTGYLSTRQPRDAETQNRFVELSWNVKSYSRYPHHFFFFFEMIGWREPRREKKKKKYIYRNKDRSRCARVG